MDAKKNKKMEKLKIVILIEGADNKWYRVFCKEATEGYYWITKSISFP